MNDILGVGYFVFEVSDPAAWHRLLVDVIGATPGDTAADGAMAYRLDDRRARIFLKQGPADDLVALGLEARDARAMEDITDRAADAGASPAPSYAPSRFVAELLRVREPGGLAIEVFRDPERVSTPLDARVNQGGFVTGALGVGHVALRADDPAETQAFFERVLGFRLSDFIRCDLAGGYKVDITFLHVNPRHHSVALGRGMPKHIHHFMVQPASLDDLGRAYDRCFDAGVKITQTLGRHPNDRMLSFYARTPSGFEVECGYGGVEIDDATWVPTTHDRISIWGHRRPGSMKDLHTPAKTADSRGAQTS